MTIDEQTIFEHRRRLREQEIEEATRVRFQLERASGRDAFAYDESSYENQTPFGLRLGINYDAADGYNL